MGFLFRIALLLGVVILFIPADEAETKKLAQGQSVSWFDTFDFATAAYSDVGGFCGRNRQACATGGIFVAQFQAKARTGARWVYALLDPAATKAGSQNAATPADAELPTSPASMPALATGSLREHPQTSVLPAANPDAVSIPKRGRSDFLPLPPQRRPS